MVEVEDGLDVWSVLVQSYNSPVEQRFFLYSTNSPIPDCDRKYV